MTVTQVGKDINGVTINVSGITEGDRQTYIWIPSTILNSNDGAWFTLSDARSQGYVSGFDVTDYEDNNGNITVWVYEEYYSQYKVIDLLVRNIKSSGNKDAKISATLDFEYEYSKTKKSGTEIDITPYDMNNINLFGWYIGSWIGLFEETYMYEFDKTYSGKKIYAEYLKLPVENIQQVAILMLGAEKLDSGTYNEIRKNIKDIVNDCISGAEFKAEWFNDFVEAIRNFNLSITV